MFSYRLNQVSIPHRYDQNPRTPLDAAARIFRFQFLIGTIKTLNVEGIGKRRRLFQFLIGTIKTIGLSGQLPHPVAKFQFLIGTIKTTEERNQEVEQNSVSIPHRYDQNRHLALALYEAELSFNSS